MPLPDVEELVREQHFETVAELLLLLFGRIPTVGDSVTWEGLRLEVVGMDGNRIDKVPVRPGEGSSAEQTEGMLAMGAVLPRPAQEE